MCPCSTKTREPLENNPLCPLNFPLEISWVSGDSNSNFGYLFLSVMRFSAKYQSPAPRTTFSPTCIKWVLYRHSKNLQFFVKPPKLCNMSAKNANIIAVTCFCAGNHPDLNLQNSNSCLQWCSFPFHFEHSAKITAAAVTLQENPVTLCLLGNAARQALFVGLHVET